MSCLLYDLRDKTVFITTLSYCLNKALTCSSRSGRYYNQFSYSITQGDSKFTEMFWIESLRLVLPGVKNYSFWAEGFVTRFAFISHAKLNSLNRFERAKRTEIDLYLLMRSSRPFPFSYPFWTRYNSLVNDKEPFVLSPNWYFRNWNYFPLCSIKLNVVLNWPQLNVKMVQLIITFN